MKYLGGGVVLLVVWAWLITGLVMMRHRDFATRWPHWARWTDRITTLLLPASMLGVGVVVTWLVILALTR